MGDSDPRIGGGRDVALTVVTASDTKFFPHLRNLLASLGRQTAPAESIVVVDVGLDDAQRAQLAAAGCRIAVYGGELFGDVRRDLAALEVRACLDLLLPEAEFILWLDADIWLQSRRYLAELRSFAGDYDLVVTPQMDAGYSGGRTGVHVGRGWFGLPRLSGWNHDLYVEAYGKAVAYAMASSSVMNGGFFLAPRRSAFWEEYRRRYREARCRKFGVDQVALTRTAVEARIATAVLDAGFNWLCSFWQPVLDASSDFFRKPNPPYDVIRAIHLADAAKWQPYAIRRVGGGERQVAFYDPATVAAAIDACAAHDERRR